MAIIRPFRAIRPVPEKAEKVAALPYDVMNSEEARQMVKGNPYSFIHVDKAEVDLDSSIDIYDKRVYQKAKQNMDNMIKEGIMLQDEKPLFYIYCLTMNGKSQTGLVVCTSIDEYLNNTIKKHELTRADKEADRICHVDTLNANTGPIFLAYHKNDAVKAILCSVMKKEKAVYNFISEDGIGHKVWLISDERDILKLIELFEKIPNLYIADGHHRNASAVKVGLKRRENKTDYTGEEEFNYYLSVLFSDDELYIMDYNRVVKDLNGLTEQQFLEKVSEKFEIEVYDGKDCCKPEKCHQFGMYLNHKWYLITAKKEIIRKDIVAALDVSILQNEILEPILAIGDPRTDKRIDFIGGIRGLEALQQKVDSKDMKIAFSMYPTSMQELMNVADENRTMPPKSTWFEPKLRSGLFIHDLEK
ncbi:DUF1015 family protein [Clostridium sp. MD294]|uniref:DUF1015 domain-containing protein n=1 Tax=Clostridium sp. MD294 TaxID=97138 RepID=UPI0002C8FEAA|nr:DUF1015 family protein [Clostridium sp. MD294]NDO47363.1 DUF1015 domain-containing protein [Clostridium sp. MD294]USF29567.1 hypothetical protein C820_000967 [Clostridium sp. MD294]